MTNNPVIVSEDIFLKAALEYCRRTKKEPFASSGNWTTYVHDARDELAELAEKINSLKAVGAI